MSLNTRCPACQTVFKVVPDQLKVSSGWVRCGRCAEVFDATTHMLPANPSAASPPKPSPSAQTTQPTFRPIQPTQAAQTGQPSQPSQPTQAKPEQPRAEYQWFDNTVKDAAAASHHAAELETETETETEEATDVAATKQESMAELSFVRRAQRKAFWQQRHVMLGLWALLSSLGALLIGQVLFDQRHVLAAMYPEQQSRLEQLFSPMDGKIQPVKQLDALEIASSTFQKTQSTEQGESFDLRITLKNKANIPLAAPAVELSLTNANDQALVRRVLSAKEIGYANNTLAASSEWQGSIPIFVKNLPSVSAETTITGYRVLVFYPS